MIILGLLDDKLNPLSWMAGDGHGDDADGDDEEEDDLVDDDDDGRDARRLTTAPILDSQRFGRAEHDGTCDTPLHPTPHCTHMYCRPSHPSLSPCASCVVLGLPLQRSRSARHRHTASAIVAAPLEHRAAVRLRLAATLAAAACVEAVACAVAGRVGTVTPPVQADAAVADAATPATAVVVAVTLQVRAAVMAATSTSPHIASPARQCRVLETRTCPAATAAVAIQAPAMTAPVVALVAVVTADDEVMWMTTGGGVAPHAVTVAAIALLPTMV